MQNTTLDSAFVNRLKHILADRYGKDLQIRQLMDLDQGYNEDVFVRGSDLHIPIIVNGSLLGTAVVPSAKDLDEEKRHGVAQLVRMVLEPAMYKWYLETKETNLIRIMDAKLDVTNVRLFADKDYYLNEEFEEVSFSDEFASTGELNTCLIHLEGCNENINKKVAFSLHDLTSRWAFVPFNDVKGQLHSAQDIAKMGSVTIFVENIENLNSAEQELIMEYVSEQPTSDGPLIISSSSMKSDELSSLKHLEKGLIGELCANCFEVDRAPLSNQALKEVLELFFIKEPLLDA